MRRLEVVDLVAIACDMWECDPAKALERLDLQALEQAIADAFSPDPEPNPEHSGAGAGAGVGGGQGPGPLALASAHLVATLLITHAAGDDTPYFALVALTCLATSNGYELQVDARAVSKAFTALAAGTLHPDDAAQWLEANLVPVRHVEGAQAAERELPDAEELAWPEEGAEPAGPPGQAAPSYIRLSKHGQRATDAARDQARRWRHRAVGTEHLLLALALVPGSRATTLLLAYGVDSEDISRRVISRQVGQLASRGRVRFDPHPAATPAYRMAIDAACQHAERSGKSEVDTGDILLVLLNDDVGGAARQILEELVDVRQLRRSARAGQWTTGPRRDTTTAPQTNDPGSPTAVNYRLDGAAADVRRCLRRLAPDAEVSSVDVHGTDGPDPKVVVAIATPQPGLLIGRKGATAELIRRELVGLFDTGNVLLNIQEVKAPG